MTDKNKLANHAIADAVLHGTGAMLHDGKGGLSRVSPQELMPPVGVYSMKPSTDDDGEDATDFSMKEPHYGFDFGKVYRCEYSCKVGNYVGNEWVWAIALTPWTKPAHSKRSFPTMDEAEDDAYAYLKSEGWKRTDEV